MCLYKTGENKCMAELLAFIKRERLQYIELPN